MLVQNLSSFAYICVFHYHSITMQYHHSLTLVIQYALISTKLWGKNQNTTVRIVLHGKKNTGKYLSNQQTSGCSFYMFFIWSFKSWLLFHLASELTGLALSHKSYLICYSIEYNLFSISLTLIYRYILHPYGYYCIAGIQKAYVKPLTGTCTESGRMWSSWQR